MNAAVTGGTGFVGRALTAQLLARGDSVRVLVRNPNDDARVRAMGATPFRGDLSRDDPLEGFVQPGDVLYHAVARVDLTGAWAEFQNLTIDGTRRLLDAALPAKPARVVYISTAGVYPIGGHERIAADVTPATPDDFNLYGRAKVEAERMTQDMCDAAGVSWSVARIGATYGPERRSLLTHFAPMLASGRLRLIGDGNNVIAALYIDDAARAILLAGEHAGAHRKIYDVVGDDRVTQRQWFFGIADALGLPRPEQSVPRNVAFAAATGAEWLAAMRGTQPQFNRMMIALVSAEQVLDASRIRNALGWRAEVSFEAGMRRTADWCAGLRERFSGSSQPWWEAAAMQWRSSPAAPASSKADPSDAG